MSTENCDHNCETCGETCADRIEKAALNPRSSVKKVIGVISGKGGVGKSLVSALLSVELAKAGLKVALMDADVTGPSIPAMFGLKGKAEGDGSVIFPRFTAHGIAVMSAAMLLEKDDDPIVWRGPLVGNLVKQFYSDVLWEDIDVMVIDMPPGTGDVALTVFQSIPMTGILIVTSPQDLVATIVRKAVHMADMMKIPVLGVIENMSYIACPHCGEHIALHGASHTDAWAAEYHLPILARIPLQAEISGAIDRGEAESLAVDYLQEAAKVIQSR